MKNDVLQAVGLLQLWGGQIAGLKPQYMKCMISSMMITRKVF